MRRENPSRPAARHTLTIRTAAPASGRLSRHAERELRDLCRCTGLHPAHVVRVLIECALDSFTEEPGWIEELIDAARVVATGGDVPGCWLQEDDGDSEPTEPGE